MLTLERLQGQEIFINTMELRSCDHQLTLSMNVQCTGDEGTVIFRNVSSLSIDDLSYPLQISGFEVIDNQCNGWQSDVRYRVHDYENGSICFYCASIEVST